MTPCDRLKNVDIAVLFLYKVLQANKIIWKKIILPTNPNFKKHVTGNTYFFVWPMNYLTSIFY